MTERKRIFVGGLFAEVTKAELTRRFSAFGDVLGVDVKVRKDDNGTPIKTFAYVDVDFTEANLKKCFRTYNKNKWKGNELKLEVARENFLDKLEAERLEPVKPTKGGAPETDGKVPTHAVQIKGAVPGTPVPGERNWIVGRYGRVLPIVYLRRKDKRKISKMDPSKFCHQVKRIKSVEKESIDLPASNLTWQLDVKDTEILKRRMGNFPEFHPKPRVKTRFKSDSAVCSRKESPQCTLDISSNGDEKFRAGELEVVPLTKKSLTVRERMLQLAGMSTGAESDESDNVSICTDEIIASSNTKLMNHTSAQNETDDTIKIMKDSSLKTSKTNLTLQSDSKTLIDFSKTGSGVSVKEFKRTKKRKENRVDSAGKNNCPVKQTSSNLVLEELLKGLDDSESSEDDQMLEKNRNKPPPFKGTQLLKEDGKSVKKAAIDSRKPVNKICDRLRSKSLTKCIPSSNETLLKSSKSKNILGKNSRHELFLSDNMADISLGKRTSTNVPILPSVEIVDNRKRPRADNSRQMSFLYDEFSSGLLPDGATYVLGRTRESSSSESEYDSEDYQALELSTFERKKKVVGTVKLHSSKKCRSLVSDKQVDSALDIFSSDFPTNDSENSTMDSDNLPIEDHTSDDCSSNSEPTDEDQSKTGIVKTPDMSSILSHGSKPAVSPSVSVISPSLSERIVEPRSMKLEAYNSDSGESSIYDSPTNQRKSNLLSSSTPIPMMQSAVKGYNSMDQSLMLDEFSSGFLANAHDLTLEGTYSDSSSESESDDFESVSRTAESSSLNETFSYSHHLDEGRSEAGSKSETENSDEKVPSLKNVETKGSPSDTSSAFLISKTSHNKDSIVKEMSGSMSPKAKKFENVSDGSQDKHTLDNQKRLASLRQRQRETQAQKSVVQQALKSVDVVSVSPNKKIVFSEDDDGALGEAIDAQSSDEDEALKKMPFSSKNLSKERARLFESSSEHSDGSSSEEHSDSEFFNIKSQFEGKAGKKLLDLQARFGNDARFKLDERFLASDDEENGTPLKIAENSERTNTLNILRDIGSGKLPSQIDANNRKRTFRSMLHYDPTIDEHKQFEEIMNRAPTLCNEGSKSSPSKAGTSDDTGGDLSLQSQCSQESVPDVGKEQFYNVSSTLVDVFGKTDDPRRESTGFSLLAAFGREDTADASRGEDSIVEDGRDKISLREGRKFPSWQEAEVLDSSGHEDMDVSVDSTRDNLNSTEEPAIDVFSQRKEMFFFTEDDPRLKEGVAFFCRQEDLETIREKWLAARPRLVEAYRSKHKRVARRIKIVHSKQGQRTFQQK